MSESIWGDPAKLTLSGGRWHSSANRVSKFRMSVEDDYSGLRVLEIELEANQVLDLLTGTVMTVDGLLAKPIVLSRLGWKAVRTTSAIPKEVTSGAYGEAALKLATDWYEEQPESGNVDSYVIKFRHGLFRVSTITWVPREVYERELALDQESEELDMDDDGLD